MVETRELALVRIRIRRFGMNNEADRKVDWFMKKYPSFGAQREVIESGIAVPLDEYRQPISVDAAVASLARRHGVPVPEPAAPPPAAPPVSMETLVPHPYRPNPTFADAQRLADMSRGMPVTAVGNARRRVFFSFFDEDFELAERLHDAIELAGHEIWWSEDILAGDTPEHAMNAAMERSDALVLVLSAKGLERNPAYDLPEPFRAAELDNEIPSAEPRRVIPVRLDPCEAPSIYLGDGRSLAELAAVDLFSDESWRRGLRRILRSLAAER